MANANASFSGQEKPVAMGLFKADLYRNFAIGFAVGALIVALGSLSDWSSGDLSDTAYAASAESGKADR